jgi:two-component system, cell cycle sensor histidine kinase and response regulator CckA
MEAIGNLTGGVAHDFNNLLTVMIGNLDLLLEANAASPQTTQTVDTILEAALRGAELTKQMLAFSRQQPLQPKQVDVNALADKTMKLLSRTLGGAIHIDLRKAPEQCQILVDAAQLEAALVNIAINARDAMPNGGTLAVATDKVLFTDEDAARRPGLTAGEHVVVKIADTGAGMSSEVMSHIFEPFYTTKEQGKGTGLGLSTVYGIVKQSGGDVEVDTTLGMGTTFRILFPRYREAPSLHRASPAGIVAARSRGTILLVEDEDAVRTLGMRILRREGYTVYVASNAAEAETLFASNGAEIALLISDLVLPGISGIDLAKRLRAKRPALNVLLMSGYTDRDVGEFQREMPDVSFLQKPFTPDSLVGRVSTAFGETGSSVVEAARENRV